MWDAVTRCIVFDVGGPLLSGDVVSVTLNVGLFLSKHRSTLYPLQADGIIKMTNPSWRFFLDDDAHFHDTNGLAVAVSETLKRLYAGMIHQVAV